MFLSGRSWVNLAKLCSPNVMWQQTSVGKKTPFKSSKVVIEQFNKKIQPQIENHFQIFPPFPKFIYNLLNSPNTFTKYVLKIALKSYATIKSRISRVYTRIWRGSRNPVSQKPATESISLFYEKLFWIAKTQKCERFSSQNYLF